MKLVNEIYRFANTVAATRDPFDNGGASKRNNYWSTGVESGGEGDVAEGLLGQSIWIPLLVKMRQKSGQRQSIPF